jgi:Icc protein
MQSIRLVQFTDTHLSGDPAARLRGVVTLTALQTAMSHARKHLEQADAVLLTGDLVQDDARGYQWIQRVFGDSAVPVLCLPGNHDLPDDMRTELAAPPFRVGGATKLGNWLIVMLDSWVANSARGRLGPEQLQYLDAEIKSHPDLHVLVCLHHHPITMHSRWLDEVGLTDSRDFLHVLRQHSNVRGVLWGHVHQALDTLVHNMRFMASPSTCAQFLPGSTDFAIDQRPPAYRVLELLPNGFINSEVLWVNGAELEASAPLSQASGT